MTDISFHFNLPSRIGYAVGLIEPVIKQGLVVVVLGEQDVLQRLSAQLWEQSPASFTCHYLEGADQTVLRHSNIMLTSQLDRMAVLAPKADILVNLLTEVPTGFERFARVIELVSNDAQERAEARTRWKYYAQAGYAIDKMDHMTENFEN